MKMAWGGKRNDTGPNPVFTLPHAPQYQHQPAVNQSTTQSNKQTNPSKTQWNTQITVTNVIQLCSKVALIYKLSITGFHFRSEQTNEENRNVSLSSSVLKYWEKSISTLWWTYLTTSSSLFLLSSCLSNLAVLVLMLDCLTWFSVPEILSTTSTSLFISLISREAPTLLLGGTEQVQDIW